MRTTPFMMVACLAGTLMLGGCPRVDGYAYGDGDETPCLDCDENLPGNGTTAPDGTVPPDDCDADGTCACSCDCNCDCGVVDPEPWPCEPVYMEWERCIDASGGDPARCWELEAAIMDCESQPYPPDPCFVDPASGMYICPMPDDPCILPTGEYICPVDPDPQDPALLCERIMMDLEACYAQVGPNTPECVPIEQMLADCWR